MRFLVQTFGGAIATACMGLFLIGCSLTDSMLKSEAPEAVVLDDGTTIPCRILEINDQNLVIVAQNPNDAFQYGNKIPVSKIKWIRVMRDQQPAYLTIDEYLKLYADQYETTPMLQGDTANAGADVAIAAADSGETKPHLSESGRKTESITPGLRLETAILDTARSQPISSPIGLRLPKLVSPPSLAPAPDYADLADFLIASGAAGLVLYRAEKFTEDGGKLSQPRYELINAIRSSKLWQQRKAGLQEAQRVAEAAFNEHYPSIQEEMKRELGFRASENGDPFKQFMLFLKSHGSLYTKSQRDRVQLWFGREAAQAFFDIQANFDDWYYIAVISTRELEL